MQEEEKWPPEGTTLVSEDILEENVNEVVEEEEWPPKGTTIVSAEMQADEGEEVPKLDISAMQEVLNNIQNPTNLTQPTGMMTFEDANQEELNSYLQANIETQPEVVQAMQGVETPLVQAAKENIKIENDILDYEKDKTYDQLIAEQQVVIGDILKSDLTVGEKEKKISNLRAPSKYTFKDGEPGLVLREEFKELSNTVNGKIGTVGTENFREGEFKPGDIMTQEDLMAKGSEVFNDVLMSDPLVKQKLEAYKQIFLPQAHSYMTLLEDNNKYDLTTQDGVDAVQEKVNDYYAELLESAMQNDPSIKARTQSIGQIVQDELGEKNLALDRSKHALYVGSDYMQGWSEKNLGWLGRRLSDITAGTEALSVGAADFTWDMGNTIGAQIDGMQIGSNEKGLAKLDEFISEGKSNDEEVTVVLPNPLGFGDDIVYKGTIPELEEQFSENVQMGTESLIENVDQIESFKNFQDLGVQAKFSDGVSFRDLMVGLGGSLPTMAAASAGTVATIVAPEVMIPLISALGTTAVSANYYADNFMTTLEQGIRDNSEKYPGGVNQENLKKALIDGEFNNVAEDAAAAALMGRLEKLGSSASVKSLYKVMKVNPIQGIKSLYKGEIKAYINNVKKGALTVGQNSLTEGLTEYGQGAIQQINQGFKEGGITNVGKYIDTDELYEQGLAGASIGAVIPFAGQIRNQVGGEYRNIAMKFAERFPMKLNKNLVRRNEFFKEISAEVKKKYSDANGNIINKVNYQKEMNAISDIRNAGLKIPSNFSEDGRTESLNLLLERQKLLREIAETDEEAFTKDQKVRVKEINTKLESINQIENAHAMAVKAVKGTGKNVNIIRATNAKDAEQQMKDLGLKNTKGKASGKFGIHISEGVDGKRTIILNEDAIGKRNKWTTAQHEVLHEVLTETLKLNPRNVFALENSVWNKLGNLDPKTFKDSNLRKRIDQYQKNRKLNKEVKAEETLTLFSEALASGDIKFEKKWFEGAGDLIRRVLQQIAPNSKLGKIKFDTAEDVYKFMKDYNKSMKKGKFTKAQKKMIEQGAQVSDKLTGEVKGKQEKTTREQMKPSLEEDFDNIIDEDSNMFDESYMDDLDIVEEVEDSDIESVDADLETDADAFLATEEFRGVVNSIANQYRMNPKYNANKDILVDELLTNDRGVLGLVKSYMQKKNDGSLPIDPKTKKPITVGQFVNNRTGGIRQRAKQIAADVLGMKSDKPKRETVIPEGRKELESLRKDLKITEKDPVYKEILDKVVKTFKGMLPTVSSKKLISALEKEFRREMFDTVKNLMGKPGSQQYKDFLNTYGEAIYNKLTQRQINKRFNEFAEPVIDPSTGKQKRMGVGESQAVGTRVKDIKAGNPIFTKKKYNEKAFEDFHLKPKKGRPASKQTALAEAVAEIMGFDAAQEALRSEEVRERRSELAGEDEYNALVGELTNATARGVDFKFSEIEDPIAMPDFNSEQVEQITDLLETVGLDISPEALELYTQVLDQDVQDWLNDSGILDMFGEGMQGYKRPLLKENWGVFENLKDSYIENLTNKNNEVAMRELSEAVDNMIDILPPIVLKHLPPSLLGLISGGRLLDTSKKRSDTNFKYLEDKYYKKVSSIENIEAETQKFIDQHGFDPGNVQIMNANFGLFNDIQKVLAKEMPWREKQKLIEKEYGQKINNANFANPKMYNYLANEFAKASVKNPETFLGLARLLEGNTNNTKGLRGLTTLSLIEFDNKSQAPYFNPSTGKFAFTASQAQRMNIPINKDHYLYKEAVALTNETVGIWAQNQALKGKEITPEILQAVYDSQLASRLRFKGEHVDPQANVSRKITKAIADYATKVKAGENVDVVTNEFNNNINRILENYDQTLGAEVLSFMQDKKLGSTSKLAFLRNMVIPKNKMNKWRTMEGLNAEQYTAKKIEDQNKIVNLKREQQQAANDNVVELKSSEVLNVEDGMSIEDVINKAATIDEALSKARKFNQPVKKIRVFDFDDTLATTKSNVLYKMPDGTKGSLTAEEFAEQGSVLESQGATFDFSEFNKVTKGAKGPLFEIAKKIKEARGNEDLYVLTARSSEAQQAIYEFLKSQGVEFKKENIIGLGNSSGAAKANWIVDKAAEGYNDFYFADDAIQNVKAVRDALEVIDVKSEVQQAKMKFSEDLDQEFNDIIEQTMGLGSMKRYSEARAQVVGADKGRFKFWVPSSAEDFLGLIYKTLGKGAVGEAQMAWWKKNLLDPYARGQENLSKARLQLMNDFKALKKTLNVPKELSKKTPTGFTNEQAVRTYLWNKNGQEIPGLSKRDIKELTAIVENNRILKEFADKLQEINKEAYPKPGKNWLVGSITSDLIDGLNTTKREKYLAEWRQNADAIFSKENLNKLESLYGPKYREALENILSRMKSGKNRTTSGNRLTNRIMDYINASNGAIMFFNMRSAALQTLSAVNFINFGVNNPYQAGKAFANQPQYWKDFKELMNSDYLKDRRNGLRLNINESEIADAAKTSKNKAKGVLNYMLKLGYTPTQIADSFAIASGGATYYRNRINQLIKEGKTQAEAKEIAMMEFRQIAEESQQSSDPSRISSQQASPLGRLILMFANTPMQYARIQKRAFQDLANGRGSKKKNISKIIYYGMVQNMMFNALQQALFAVGFGDDELSEDEEKKVLNTVNGMLDSTLRGLGVGGVAVSVTKNFLLDIYERSQRSRPEYADSVWKLMQFSPPISSKISKLKQAAWHFNSKKRREEIYDKGFSLDNPAYEAAAKVITAVTNAPLDRVMYKYHNIEAAMSEETEWWQKVALISGWPKWQLENKEDEPKSKKKKKKNTNYKKKTSRYKKVTP